jgi:hypothetical protein
MTANEVIAVLGPVDETVIAEILKTGATAEELALAWTWIHADEALINQGRRYPSGRAAELVGILESMERDVEA